MTLGITVGKLYPFHLGHERALEVLGGRRPDVAFTSGWLVEALEARQRRYVSVGGSPGERLAAAVQEIEPLLAFARLESR